MRPATFPRAPLSPARRAALAQSVEHLIRNEGVAGSNPACGTIFTRLNEHVTPYIGGPNGSSLQVRGWSQWSPSANEITLARGPSLGSTD